MTKNQRARELKISGNTPRYPYFLLLKFQLGRTMFDLFLVSFSKQKNQLTPILQIFKVKINQVRLNPIFSKLFQKSKNTFKIYIS